MEPEILAAFLISGIWYNTIQKLLMSIVAIYYSVKLVNIVQCSGSLLDETHFPSSVVAHKISSWAVTAEAWYLYRC